MNILLLHDNIFSLYFVYQNIILVIFGHNIMYFNNSRRKLTQPKRKRERLWLIQLKSSEWKLRYVTFHIPKEWRKGKSLSVHRTLLWALEWNRIWCSGFCLSYYLFSSWKRKKTHLSPFHFLSSPITTTKDCNL